MTQWWRKEISNITESLKTNLDNGLTSDQVKQKLEQFGPNQLTENKGPSALEIFLD